MRKHATTLAISTIFFSSAAFAQTRTRVTIDEATVFLRGAQLTSSAAISIPAGESEFLFTNIAGNINQNSINVGTTAEVAVQSVIFKNDYLGDSSISPRVRVLSDSIAVLHRRRGPIEDEKQVVADQLETLRANRDLSSGKGGLTALELQKLLDLVSQRTESLLRRHRALDSADGALTNRINLLQSQVGQEQQKGFQPGGAVLVRFHSQKPISTRVNISYVTPNAGWSPAYDLRVERVNSPVRLFYKAHVYQNSGVKWDKVQLVLSTGNPTEGAEAPVFSAQYVDENKQSQTYQYKSSSGEVITRTTQRYVAPIIDPKEPGGRSTKTAVQVEAAATRNSSDIAGLSTQSYQQGRGAGISIGGGRTAPSPIIIDGVTQNPAASLSTYTFADGRGINTTFDIDLPYDIPTDGQQHTVAVKTYQLPATYRYYTAPRQDRDVFLQAQVTNWEDYNLIPAPTNIFFEGYYVGQGRLDMTNVKDTLNLSLGRDKKVIVKRERDRNFRSEKIIGTNVRQEYAWTISVRNTRAEAINLVVVDQIPVSSRNDIVIEDVKAPTGTMDELTGKVEWNLQLKPSELKNLQTRFTLRYPKHVAVAGL